MTPRRSHSPAPSVPTPRSISAPHHRRYEPKTSRRQHSACGACRMRRVRCDLKDVASGIHAACSNCQQRGLHCVDEFADVKAAKAVKILRTGRRLQQVEAIYGTGGRHEPPSLTLVPQSPLLPSIIPQLKPEFFLSAFWRWFSLQRPFLDSTELPDRFFAHTKGTQYLVNEGKILMLVLLVWAASFGIDEYGLPENDELSTVGERKHKIEEMIHEVLVLIDSHAIMRKPTWDGMRVLLLILPLLENVSDLSPIDYRCMYEATLSQIATCALSDQRSMAFGSSRPGSEYPIIRARLLSYSHMYEGITIGMKGGRFVLTEDDIDAFQNIINTSPYPSPGPPSLLPGTHGPSVEVLHFHPPLGAAIHSHGNTTEGFEIPLQLSSVCRRVCAVLTGTRATYRAHEGGGVDAEGMRNIWDGLEQCWDAFEGLRNRPASLAGESQMFISGWQIFIFECHNVIRETLKQHSMQADSISPLYSASPFPRSTYSDATHLLPQELHAIASRKCLGLLPSVLGIMRSHLTGDGMILFNLDAGLVRDGCFFAGFLCASIDNDAAEFAVENQEFRRADMDGVRSELDLEEGMRLCLSALKEMNWVFSRSRERSETVWRVWEDKQARKLERQGAHHSPFPSYDMEYHSQLPTTYPEPSYSPFPSNPAHSHLPLPLLDRTLLPPLNFMLRDSPSPHDLCSAPSTTQIRDSASGSGWSPFNQHDAMVGVKFSDAQA
ncbi:hypothetical protein FB451DRAFT_1149544 [Mycena latifolia]|nr:hypothetical protein FB451DRAFT_1149544 [Mycena latifolia]